MHVSPEQLIYSEAPLQLLLFVDERPSSQQQIEQIHHYLRELQAEYPFALQVVNVGEQPSVAEQFKLVATPALIKIHPEPRQTLAGSNLLSQLKHWWSRWQHAVEHLKLQNVAESIDKDSCVSTPNLSSVPNSVELLQLADEVFHLKREQEKLLEQLHFKDKVISMLAHDLRNPLTAVSIAIETLESNLVPHKSDRLTPALASQLFKQARTQTRTIERMITGLLQVASHTAADLHIQPQKLELGKLCQDVIAHLRDRAIGKFQTIEADIPNDLPCVYADLERVKQVLTNLLDNAIKYTPVGGIIRICGFHRTTQKVQISVCDTGPGIPEADRNHIFAERFQLERAPAKEGSGIGLSLCQLIIQAHYGQLWVDFPSAGGSCFHFTLPVYPN